MTNKGRPNGSRHIDPEMRALACQLRRDGVILRTIVQRTGISPAHLKTIFRQENLPAKHRGRPPGIQSHRKGQRTVGPKKKPARSNAQRAIARPKKPERKRQRGDYSVVTAMKIEERMRKRREAEERAREVSEAPET